MVKRSFENSPNSNYDNYFGSLSLSPELSRYFSARSSPLLRRNRESPSIHDSHFNNVPQMLEAPSPIEYFYSPMMDASECRITKYECNDSADRAALRRKSIKLESLLCAGRTAAILLASLPSGEDCAAMTVAYNSATRSILMKAFINLGDLDKEASIELANRMIQRLVAECIASNLRFVVASVPLHLEQLFASYGFDNLNFEYERLPPLPSGYMVLPLDDLSTPSDILSTNGRLIENIDMMYLA